VKGGKKWFWGEGVSGGGDEGKKGKKEEEGKRGRKKNKYTIKPWTLVELILV